MTTIYDGREPFPPAIRTRDFSLLEDEEGAKLARGRDKSGKPWRLTLPVQKHGAWVSDQGGARTYFFAGYTGGVGMAPDTWIVALSFDEQDRPVPFFVTTYGAYDNQGITDLVDLDAHGPVLLQQDGSKTSPGSQIESAFFITTAYQQRGVYWYRADGRHGSKVFPVFDKWALLPNSARTGLRHRRISLS